MNVIILGMHRSGTSMLSGLLEKAGFYVGSESELLKSGEQNLKGFYERKDIRDVNDEILKENFFDWDIVAGYSVDVLSKESRLSYQQKIESILNSFSTHGNWLLKEPRFCLLYPLIKELTCNSLKVVIYRDPFSTAKSLWIRNGIAFQYGLLLWEKYYTLLINELRTEENVYVVRYESLVSSPQDEVIELLNWLSKQSGMEFDSDLASNAVNFIDEKLNRNKKSVLHDGLQALSDNQQLILQMLDHYKSNGLTRIPASNYLDILLEQNQLLHMEFKRLQLENKEIKKIKSRLSWELTKPLRYFGDKFPGAAMFVDKMTRLIVRAIKLFLFKNNSSKRHLYWNLPDELDTEIKTYKNTTKATNNIAVVTAIFGGYDKLSIPFKLQDEIDYICFTDNPIDSYGIWQIRQTPYYHPCPTRMARYVKLHLLDLLSEYETLIWVDGNIVICGDLMKYVHAFDVNDTDIGLISHPLRDCIYEEAKACIQRAKDNELAINTQVEHYRKLGIPKKSGLFETNFFITRKSQKSRRFFKAWWGEIERFTKRDQLSVVVAQHASDIKYSYIMPRHLSVRNNKDFKIVEHAYMRHFSLPEYLKSYSQIVDPVPGANRFDSVIQQETKQVAGLTIDIIVCVHNALDDVKGCLESVIKYRGVNENLIIINDYSDKETTDYLSSTFSTQQGVKLIHNDENLGYIRSANIGMKQSNADLVILLNSDTLVVKNWANKIATVAFSQSNIGIVGPMSNAAGYQSIPEIKRTKEQTAINPVPSHLTLESINELCGELAYHNFYPRVPLVHGFCFAIKREVIDEIGYFDDVHFQKYYGEENDYCFRAKKAGFELAIATNTYIYHSKSKSIDDDERVKYMGLAGKQLRILHGAVAVKTACEQMENHPLLIRMRIESKPVFDRES